MKTLALVCKTKLLNILRGASASFLALIALNLTFPLRYPALGLDSLVQQIMTIGFGFQLLVIMVPVALTGLVVTRSMLTAFA